MTFTIMTSPRAGVEAGLKEILRRRILESKAEEVEDTQTRILTSRHPEEGLLHRARLLLKEQIMRLEGVIAVVAAVEAMNGLIPG